MSIFVAVVLSYWAFVRYYERRAVQELSLRLRWIALAAVAGSLSIGVTILVLYATGHYQLISFRGFGPEDSLVNLFVSLVICAVLWRLVRRTGKVLAAGFPVTTSATHPTDQPPLPA